VPAYGVRAMMDRMVSASPGIAVRPALLPRAAVVITLVGYVAAVVVAAEIVQARDWGNVGPVALPFAWLVAASLAVKARPDHPGALLFVSLGAAHLAGFALGLPVALDGSTGWAAWATNVAGLLCYALGFAALGAFLATYPTGLPHDALERWFLRLAFPSTVVGVVVDVLTHDRVELAIEAGGRATMPAPPGLPIGPFAVSIGTVVPLLVVVGAVLLIVRGRRSTGGERRQLSWAIGGGGLLALMIALSPLLERLVAPQASSVAFVLVASVIPFVLLAGLVRYRLMDVDVYVTRTLASGTAVVIALAVYAVVAGVTADNRGATAAVVVAAALTGVPLVRWLSGVADRWFSGGRVRGQALLRQLAESLADSSASPDELARRTARTVADSLDVSWVRVIGGEVDAVTGEPSGDPALVLPLLAGTRSVGRLECGPRHGGWSPSEVAELELLAHQAALALHNASLSRRLAGQVEELQASRTRLVRAELDVRRRLERDLHDGVQQQVVALAAHLGALRVMVQAESPARTVLETAQRQVGLCLAELRAVVSGVQPPVLLDQGVVAAVESRAGLLPLPVHVESVLDRRFPQMTEAAAFYVVSEALTNVVKHADAAAATVRFSGTEELVVEVHDDGHGMSMDAARRGLNGLRDRVEALDGTLTVSSGETGTTVTARMPLAGRGGDW
jgi:signal transduction histidine kinase